MYPYLLPNEDNFKDLRPAFSFPPSTLGYKVERRIYLPICRRRVSTPSTLPSLTRSRGGLLGGLHVYNNP